MEEKFDDNSLNAISIFLTNDLKKAFFRVCSEFIKKISFEIFCRRADGFGEIHEELHPIVKIK